MNLIRLATCALALGFWAPVWAVNKCTDAHGKVSFQDAACPGKGEKIEVRPAMQGATLIAPAAATANEGAFGASWQRKNYLQSQGVPQARAAIVREQGACGAVQQEGTAHSGPLRRSLGAGSMFAQERAVAVAKDKNACASRIEELRRHLKSLEDELAKL